MLQPRTHVESLNFFLNIFFCVELEFDTNFVCPAFSLPRNVVDPVNRPAGSGEAH